jgi:hypothetical protein
VSRALVAEVAVPPHSVAPPEHVTDADAFETLTGPDTAATPVAMPAASAGSRSATVVSAEVVQPPPAPRAVQDEEPVLSRAPMTSPDADPDVVPLPVPAHPAISQVTLAPAELAANSSLPGAGAPVAALRIDRSSLALSPTSEADSAVHLPADAVQDEDPLVSRTDAAAPGTAERPVTLPVLPLSQAPPSVSQVASACDWSARVSATQAPMHDADAAVRRSAPSDDDSPPPPDSLRQEPPPDSHAALALSGVAVLDCPHPRASPSHLADARDSPSAPRLDALLPQPDSSHDASAFDSPEDEDAPQPDTPDRATHRSESRSPSADSLTDPHSTNAPSEPHPAAAPSPSRSSSDASRTSRSVASINSSVAS